MGSTVFGFRSLVTQSGLVRLLLLMYHNYILVFSSSIYSFSLPFLSCLSLSCIYSDNSVCVSFEQQRLMYLNYILVFSSSIYHSISLPFSLCLSLSCIYSNDVCVVSFLWTARIQDPTLTNRMSIPVSSDHQQQTIIGWPLQITVNSAAITLLSFCRAELAACMRCQLVTFVCASAKHPSIPASVPMISSSPPLYHREQFNAERTCSHCGRLLFSVWFKFAVVHMGVFG